MHADRRPFVGGNWKMNGDLAGSTELADDVVAAIGQTEIDAVVFPPYPYLVPVGHTLGHHGVELGAQDCSSEANGAFTGQVSADMLVDIGCKWTVIGHSERRHGLGEGDDLLHDKMHIALETGLGVVFCVGETGQERDAGRAEAIIARQVRQGFKELAPETVRSVVVAYEPVWAIGTGVTATPQDAQQMHAFLREVLADLYDQRFAAQARIIYGGSANAKNARALFDQPDVDGGLIGGASLKAQDFATICRAAAEAWRAAGGH
ncbi:MAG: triose-phosphate isomerase [Phycisphaerae bacterium]|nr:triose-phosphate isomerase [Phycisphaerae bacterium]